MALRIVTAEERFKQMLAKVSILLLGPVKIGKTTQAMTLPAETTLFLDFEAGMKSIATWRGRSIPLRTLREAWDIACLVGGPDPAVGPHKPFSQAHYDSVMSAYGSLLDMKTVKNVFFDSASDLTHVARVAAEQNAQSFNKHGVFDPRSMYGVLGRDMVDFFTHLQHAEGFNTIFVAKLDRHEDQLTGISYDIQMEGQQAARVLPGLVDLVVSMSTFDFDAANNQWSHNWGKGEHRAFCCHRINPFGLPAGGRFLGNIEMIEEPHLGKLIEKLNAPVKAQAEASLSHSFNLGKK